jgi:hypothetical protein
VAGGTDARRAVDIDPDVAGIGGDRLPGVDAHPHAHGGAVRPGMTPELALSLDEGRQRAAHRRERQEQPVPRGIDARAAVTPGRRAQDPVMVGEEGGVCVAEPLEKLR